MSTITVVNYIECKSEAAASSATKTYRIQCAMCTCCDVGSRPCRVHRPRTLSLCLNTALLQLKGRRLK